MQQPLTLQASAVEFLCYLYAMDSSPNASIGAPSPADTGALVRLHDKQRQAGAVRRKLPIPWLRKAAVACALVGLVSSCSAARQKKTSQAARETAKIDGAKLYKQNCAVCHGNDGKGGNAPPASSPFTEPPPDLTTLARRHDGKFPRAYVTRVLRSGVKLSDHGPAEMPVWGTIFKSMAKSNDAQVTARINALTDYLKTIQVK